jgi:hypothetical protein
MLRGEIVTVLNYATQPPRRRIWRRWIIAAAVGVGIGMLAGKFAYEPMLRAIVGNVQLIITSMNQVLSSWLQFMAVAGFSGVVVGCSAVAAAGRRKMWFGWPILFAAAYLLGASLGLLCARAQWDSQFAILTSFARVVSNSTPHFPANLQFAVNGQLADVPALTPPICGCAAVLLVLGLLLLLRLLGTRTQPNGS